MLTVMFISYVRTMASFTGCNLILISYTVDDTEAWSGGLKVTYTVVVMYCVLVTREVTMSSPYIHTM